MHSKQGCYLYFKITTCIAIKTKSLAQKKQRLAEGEENFMVKANDCHSRKLNSIPDSS